MSHAEARPRLTGSSYKLAKFKDDRVQLDSGESLIRVYTLSDTASGSPKHKVFCSVCGCTLWTIPTLHKEAVKIVRTSLLEKGSVLRILVYRSFSPLMILCY